MAATLVCPVTLERCKAVTERTGDARSTHYKKIQDGLFTKPVRLGPRSVGWPSTEVDAILAARIAGKSDAEIRELVLDLEASRKAGGAE
jgi:prophage regulatory protein